MDKQPTIPMSEVVRAGGGVSALARALGIDKTSVRDWPWVPARRVLDVERLTGIPASKLRPDIYPPSRFANLDKRTET